MMGLTTEQYEIAESNGISKQLAYQRIKNLHWDEEIAITKTPGNADEEYMYWKSVAIDNGLTYLGFRKRLEKGMSLEMAATLPKQQPGRKQNNKEYCVYKGDNLICIGTIRECAEYMGVLVTTIQFYMSQAYRNRLAERKRSKGNHITVTELEDDEDGTETISTARA